MLQLFSICAVLVLFTIVITRLSRVVTATNMKLSFSKQVLTWNLIIVPSLVVKVCWPSTHCTSFFSCSARLWFSIFGVLPFWRFRSSAPFCVAFFSKLWHFKRFQLHSTNYLIPTFSPLSYTCIDMHTHTSKYIYICVPFCRSFYVNLLICCCCYSDRCIKMRVHHRSAADAIAIFVRLFTFLQYFNIHFAMLAEQCCLFWLRWHGRHECEPFVVYSMGFWCMSPRWEAELVTADDIITRN